MPVFSDFGVLSQNFDLVDHFIDHLNCTTAFARFDHIPQLRADLPKVACWLFVSGVVTDPRRHDLRPFVIASVAEPH